MSARTKNRITKLKLAYKVGRHLTNEYWLGLLSTLECELGIGQGSSMALCCGGLGVGPSSQPDPSLELVGLSAGLSGVLTSVAALSSQVGSLETDLKAVADDVVAIGSKVDMASFLAVKEEFSSKLGEVTMATGMVSGIVQKNTNHIDGAPQDSRHCPQDG